EYVPATGLYHIGAREYDPRTGRQLQRDPNLYRYCGNDSINHADPDGLTWYYDQRTGATHWDDPSTPPCDFQRMGYGFSGKKGRWRNNPRTFTKRHGI
ncbi:MAG: RHS repeat-associated core domain-containing protein, partial [Fimbriimonadales bacterium]